MRVFSVEMLVKEEGAAVVEAALKRLKNEANAVAAQMKTTTSQVTTTGRAMQTAGEGTRIAGDRAAKAAIGFAAVGQAIGRTGSLTADMGTRIIEAGSQVATMFGPKGLAVAAVLSFATFAISKFRQTSVEAAEMAKKFEESLAQIANAGDKVGIRQQMQNLELGIPAGALDSIVDINDGLGAVRQRIAELKATGFTTFNRANREELERLNEVLATGERNFARLRTAIEAPMPRPSGGAVPITISAAAPRTISDADRQRIAEAEQYGTRLLEDARKNILREKRQFQAPDVEKFSILPPDFVDIVSNQLEDTVNELERKSVDILLPVGAVIASGLGDGIANAIKGGITSGLEMAIASGNIGDAFRAMGQAIVSALASTMVDVALAAIGFGTLLENIRTFMMAHPALAVASAVALLALARSMGGSAKGGGMIGTGTPGGLNFSAAGVSSGPTSQIIFGATSATTAAGMTPRSSTNVTIIGPNDPSAQRAMQELLAKANSRGRVG